MPSPFELLESVPTGEGPLELRRRGAADFMISIAGRVLMTSAITSTELALAQMGCRRIVGGPCSRVLIGGLGLGFTLRAALDELPPAARVQVVELNPQIVEWCRTVAAGASGNAALDRRVRITTGDVAEEIRLHAEAGAELPYDAILWDLYVGPPRRYSETHPLYGEASLRHVHTVLREGGVFGVWGEEPSPAFERLLGRQGFEVELVKPEGRGSRHAVYLATKRPQRRWNKEGSSRKPGRSRRGR